MPDHSGRQEKKPMNVLYLPRWYPNRYDPMPGLFIERHARSVAPFCKIAVLYVHPDQSLKEKHYEIVEQKDKELFQVKVYFKFSSSKIPGIAQSKNACRYLASHIRGYRLLKKKFGKPDLIHVNVLTRLGFLALIYKFFTGTPYLITEHWTRYLPMTDTYHGYLRKLLTKLIVRKASAVLPVTDNLRKAMEGHGLRNRNYQVVPNVVDVSLFNVAGGETKFAVGGSQFAVGGNQSGEASQPKTENSKPETGNRKLETGNRLKKLIHVSCFEDKQKNISGLLHVLKKLSQTRHDWQCDMVGEGIHYEKLVRYADELGIKDRFVFFRGLKENEELVSLMQEAKFQVMFSRFENLPVVILESYACGVPVLSTDVGGISEHMNPDLGVLIPSEDETALFDQLNYMLDHNDQYNKARIRKYAEDHFSREVIGKRLFSIYQKVLA